MKLLTGNEEKSLYASLENFKEETYVTTAEL